MKAKRLPNGNLLVPTVFYVNGELLCGMKEARPGTDEYNEWAECVREAPQPVKRQPMLAMQ